VADFPIRAILRGIDLLSRPLNKAGSVLRRVGQAARFTKKDIQALGSAIADVRDRIVTFGTVGLAGAVIGLERLATSHARATDALAKFSRRAGITAQAYSELQFAADLAGVSAGDFDSAMRQFTRNLGEARRGQGTLSEALKKTNRPLLRQLRATESSQEALDLLLGAMAGMKNPADRAAFAAAAFGEAGQKMTLIMENGAEGLAAARREFRDLHKTIDGDALKSAERFVDNQARLKAAIGGVKFAIGNELLPVFEPLIKSATAWIKANRADVIQKVTAAIKSLGESISKIDFAEIGEDLSWFGGLIVDVWNLIGGLRGAVILLGVAIASKFAPALALAGKALFALGRLLLANPIVAIAVAIGAVAGLIIDNWKKIPGFFIALWEGVKSAFNAFVGFVDRNFVQPLLAMWELVATAFEAAFERVKESLGLLVKIAKVPGAIIESVTTGSDQPLREALGGGAEPGVPTPAEFSQMILAGAGAGGAPGAPGAAGKVEIGVKVEAGAGARATVTGVTSSSPGVVATANTGRRNMALGGP
jgi:hypothetical protein